MQRMGLGAKGSGCNIVPGYNSAMICENLNDLLPHVYDELRQVASNELRGERTGHTLRTTALVHEAYLRLAKLNQIQLRNRDEILKAAVGVMRRVLIDHARMRKTKKRDSKQLALISPGDGFSETVNPPSFDLLSLNDALERFAKISPLKAEVVELRYFGGQSLDEISRLLGISTATVKRYWIFARAWLYRELKVDENDVTSEQT